MFNDTAATEIYTLSLHDALPILNIYVFNRSDGINHQDLLGLTWKIERKGRERAHAMPESGDTVSDLARIIGFDDKDFHKWLKVVGPSRMPSSAMEQIGRASCRERV